MRRTTFPLVADDEFVVGENPLMDLYDESDLISNIKGPYQEKEYRGQEASADRQLSRNSRVAELEEDLLPPLFQAEVSPYSRRERLHKPTRPQHASHRPTTQKTEGQLAREKAREDLKKKRSAAYLKDDKPAPTRVVKQGPTAPLIRDRHTHLTELANRLRQTSYILADVPAVYPLEKDERGKETNIRKNSYDFLKTSQVYNYPERKIHQERQFAQELNLTHMEEE